MANTKVKRKNKTIGGKIIMKLIEILNANEALKNIDFNEGLYNVNFECEPYNENLR